MNPTLPEDYLKRMELDDPEAYRSEVLGEFRAGVTTFLDPDAWSGRMVITPSPLEQRETGIRISGQTPRPCEPMCAN